MENPEIPATGGAGRTIAGNFQCQMNLSQQRNIVVTGYIYSDDTPEEISARLDLYQDAIDRQFIRADVQNKEAQVKAMLADVERHRDHLEEIGAKTKGQGTGLPTERPPKLTSVERTALQNGQQSIKKQLEHVESLRAAIKEGRAKLGSPAA